MSHPDNIFVQPCHMCVHQYTPVQSTYLSYKGYERILCTPQLST
jgi:hypothetical protein